jgi:hypothetical protein
MSWVRLPVSLPARSAPVAHSNGSSLLVQGGRSTSGALVGGLTAFLGNGSSAFATTATSGTFSTASPTTVATTLRDRAAIVHMDAQGSAPDSRTWSIGGVHPTTGLDTSDVLVHDGRQWILLTNVTGGPFPARRSAFAVEMPSCNGTNAPWAPPEPCIFV